MFSREEIAKFIMEAINQKSIFLIDPDGHWQDFENSGDMMYGKEKEKIGMILHIIRGESEYRVMSEKRYGKGANKLAPWVLIIDSPAVVFQDSKLSKRLLAIEKNAREACIEIIEYDPRPNRFRDAFVKAGFFV